MTDLLGRCLRTCVAVYLSLGASFAAHASYSNLFVFGDSLSDTGNVYLASQGSMPPSPPYYSGRFSNGPVWIDTLAGGLGLPAGATPSLLGGNNFAWAGAFSNGDGLAGTGTGLMAQVFGQWAQTSGGSADPNALYVISIGGNDLRYVNSDNTPSTAPYSTPSTVLENFTDSLDYLIKAGAKHFLVANITDLGLTPEAVKDGHSAESTQLAKEYNTLLADALSLRKQIYDVAIAELDFFAMLDAVFADAQAGGTLYGMTNADTPCITGLVSCDTSIFFDDLHPTTRVHQLAGQIALAAIPEPGALPLVFSALIMIMIIGSGRRRSWNLPSPA